MDQHVVLRPEESSCFLHVFCAVKPSGILISVKLARHGSAYQNATNRKRSEHGMKLREIIVGLLMAGSLAPSAIAQSSLTAASSEQYLPRLGDIMNAVQTRHIKLWFAGKAQNWDLASYELRQLKAGLLEAAVLYEGIPVSNVTTMSKPVQSISDAIDVRDLKRFAAAVGELTGGCNACHQQMQRGYIVIQAPTGAPYGDQSFAPPKKP
jgi:hypothetical protein